jgi:hypothetical protein
MGCILGFDAVKMARKNCEEAVGLLRKSYLECVLEKLCSNKKCLLWALTEDTSVLIGGEGYLIETTSFRWDVHLVRRGQATTSIQGIGLRV